MDGHYAMSGQGGRLDDSLWGGRRFRELGFVFVSCVACVYTYIVITRGPRCIGEGRGGLLVSGL